MLVSRVLHDVRVERHGTVTDRHVVVVCRELRILDPVVDPFLKLKPEPWCSLFVGFPVKKVVQSGVRAVKLCLGLSPAAEIPVAVILEAKLKLALAVKALPVDALELVGSGAVPDLVDRVKRLGLVSELELCLGIVQQNLGITEQRPRESCPVGSRSTRILIPKPVWRFPWSRNSFIWSP